MYTTVVGGTLRSDGYRPVWSHGEDGFSESGSTDYAFALEGFMIAAHQYAGKMPLYFLDSSNHVLFGIDADGRYIDHW